MSQVALLSVFAVLIVNNFAHNLRLFRWRVHATLRSVEELPFDMDCGQLYTLLVEQ